MSNEPKTVSENSGVNANYELKAVMYGQKMEWKPSPHPQVLRKRLELYGPEEAGRVTSIVQYLPGSSFHSHGHPEGEEILVLEGTFQDEHGSYPAGSFLLNPEGFKHQPFSEGGCVLLVKLRQFPGINKKHVFVDTKSDESQQRWRSLSTTDGVINAAELVLYEQKDEVYEKICLLRLPPSSSFAMQQLLCDLTDADIGILMPTSELFLSELFVLEGAGCSIRSSEADSDDPVALLERWSWLRSVWNDAQHWMVTNDTDSDTVLYVKIGTRDRQLRTV